MPFVYYLQIHFWLLCSLDVLTAGLPDYGFVNDKQMAFLQIFVSKQLPIVFIFKTSGYTGQCDGLWLHTVKPILALGPILSTITVRQILVIAVREEVMAKLCLITTPILPFPAGTIRDSIEDLVPVVFPLNVEVLQI